MVRIVLEAILQVSILMPFAFIFLKSRSSLEIKRLLIFVLTYVIYQICLVLPRISTKFNLIQSSWNWEGKIYGVICGVVCYYTFRKYFKENDFFTLKQNPQHIKSTVTTAIGIVLLSTVAWFILGKTPWNTETLAFQISLPGIDEEIMFRGVLLGLLASSLKEKVLYVVSPSVVLTAILFGFTHSLTLANDYSVDFDILYFSQTAFAGYIWGWITIKSRSILLAILSHNFSNFFGTLSTMIK